MEVWHVVRRVKVDADEKELLESVERGQWTSAGCVKRERTAARAAKATFRKDRRLNIRLSSNDLEAIQKRALAEGLPYQTLIASLLHKYATGRAGKKSEPPMALIIDSLASGGSSPEPSP